MQQQQDPSLGFQRKASGDPQQVIKETLPAIQDTLAGVRNAHKVPIRVIINHERPQIGTSDEKAAGTQHTGYRITNGREPKGEWENNEQSTQYVNLYVVPGDPADHIKDVLTHEIGHVIFATSPDLQRAVQDMAYSTPAPSNYGTTNYKYKGDDTESIHHKTGNEWFAEMFKTVVLGQNPGFTNQQISQFKRVLAGAANAPHPHGGIGYRLGQTNPDYQFPGKHQPVVEPPVPDINQPTLPAEPQTYGIDQNYDRQWRKTGRRLNTKLIPGADDYQM